MTYRLRRSFALVAIWGLVAALSSVATADPAKDAKPSAPPEFKLPPGWTLEDLQACMAAGTPGKMHERIAQEVGEWKGKSTMWMMPGADPVTTDCKCTVTAMMDGRFVQTSMTGEVPGMGPYKGFGIVGYDNVSQKFVALWLDNHSTGMMNGAGSMSDNGKVITWKYDFNCPMTKKPAVMRQIETMSGPNSKTLEMWGPEPKSGKEYKMMVIELTKS